jgi:hypothetical protein
MISPKITNFSIADKNTLRLSNEEGDVVSGYSFAAGKTPSSVLPLGKGETPKAEGVYSKADVPSQNLLASAVSADPLQNDPPNNPNNIIVYCASFIFIGVSAFAVYFIRRKKLAPAFGNDFEILDE